MPATKNIRVSIVGSSTFTKLDLIDTAIRQLGPCTVFVAGAKGIKVHVKKIANKLGYPVHSHPRRTAIDLSDGVILFMNGTRHLNGTCNYARCSNKPLIVVHEQDGGVTFSTENWEWPKS